MIVRHLREKKEKYQRVAVQKRNRFVFFRLPRMRKVEGEERHEKKDKERQRFVKCITDERYRIVTQ